METINIDLATSKEFFPIIPYYIIIIIIYTHKQDRVAPVCLKCLKLCCSRNNYALIIQHNKEQALEQNGAESADISSKE